MLDNQLITLIANNIVSLSVYADSLQLLHDVEDHDIRLKKIHQFESQGHLKISNFKLPRAEENT